MKIDGEEEHAAADNRVRKPVVDDGQQNRREADRLQQPHHQVAHVGDEPHVVQIGVMQRGLADREDEQHAQESTWLGQQHPRARRRDGRSWRRRWR